MTEPAGQQDAVDQGGAVIDSERRDARQAQERTDIQRRGARDAQDRIEVQVGIERRDARDAQDLAEAAQDSERRDAEDLFDARRDSERRQVLEQNQGLHAQLRQAQRMESLGQLAGGVAHDFNNLLTVILSYATFVARRLDDAAGPGDRSWDEARADMARIQHAVGRSAALTRQLLAFASREAIRPLALDLNQVIADVEELLRRAAGEHIELATALAPGLWPVLADPGKLEQVLVNLAVNARDAMPAGGTLTITTQNTTTTAAAGPAGPGPPARADRHVQLQVSDTGTGMTPDVIEHAFEPFFTTKAATSGTGLGLATVYGILTQADASIEISSHPGTGTTFTILLPVTGQPAAPAAPAALPARHGGQSRGQTILLTEDQDELREAASRILTRAGYHVLTAASGPRALEIARHHDGPIDLLITDIVMPHMPGTEAAAKLQAIKPGTAVLYMSGYARPPRPRQGSLGPDVLVVEKPFSDADLLTKTSQALSSHHTEPTTSHRTPT